MVVLVEGAAHLKKCFEDQDGSKRQLKCHSEASLALSNMTIRSGNTSQY